MTTCASEQLEREGGVVLLGSKFTNSHSSHAPFWTHQEEGKMLPLAVLLSQVNKCYLAPEGFSKRGVVVSHQWGDASGG